MILVFSVVVVLICIHSSVLVLERSAGICAVLSFLMKLILTIKKIFLSPEPESRSMREYEIAKIIVYRYCSILLDFIFN